MLAFSALFLGSITAKLRTFLGYSVRLLDMKNCQKLLGASIQKYKIVLLPCAFQLRCQHCWLGT